MALGRMIVLSKCGTRGLSVLSVWHEGVECTKRVCGTKGMIVLSKCVALGG